MPADSRPAGSPPRPVSGPDSYEAFVRGAATAPGEQSYP